MFGIALMSAGYEVEEYGTSSVSGLGPVDVELVPGVSGRPVIKQS
jgi:hypothetical protein